MLHLKRLMIKAAITKHARFWAFSLLIRTLSWFSSASFIKLNISSGIFSPSSNKICFSSSCQFRVRYYTPMLSQWFVSCIPAVFTILWTLLEMMNSRSCAPYSSQINSPSLILMTPTRFSSSCSSWLFYIQIFTLVKFKIHTFSKMVPFSGSRSKYLPFIVIMGMHCFLEMKEYFLQPINDVINIIIQL